MRLLDHVLNVVGRSKEGSGFMGERVGVVIPFSVLAVCLCNA